MKMSPLSHVLIVATMGALVWWYSSQPEYWDFHPVPIQAPPHDTQPTRDLDEMGLTTREAEDLAFITKLHRTFPNMQWQPNIDLDDGERQQVHVVTTQPQNVRAFCGPSAVACTLTDIRPEWVDEINANEPDPRFWVFAHSCVIFMPTRHPDYPRSWFYLLGHEFAHCRYDNFHPGHPDADGARQPSLSGNDGE